MFLVSHHSLLGLSQPKSKCQKIRRQSKYCQRGGCEQTPVGRVADGNGAELEYLKDGKGQSQKSWRDEIERVTKQRDEREHEISKCNKAVMQRDSTFPREAPEKCAAFIFLVFREGDEVNNKKIRQRENGQRDEDDGQQARVFSGLKEKTNGRNDIGNVQREDEFAEAVIDEVKGRDGIRENENERSQKEEESGEREREVKMNDESDDSGCADHASRDVEQITAKGLFLFGSLTFDERFIVRTKDFAQECHAGLREQNTHKAEHEGHEQERFTQIGRDACTEEIGQRCEK